MWRWTLGWSSTTKEGQEEDQGRRCCERGGGGRGRLSTVKDVGLQFEFTTLASMLAGLPYTQKLSYLAVVEIRIIKKDVPDPHPSRFRY